MPRTDQPRTTARLRVRTYNDMKRTAVYLGIPLTGLMQMMMRWAFRTGKADDHVKWWSLAPPSTTDGEKIVVQPDMKMEFAEMVTLYQGRYGVSKSGVLEAVWTAWQLGNLDYLPYDIRDMIGDEEDEE